MSNQDQPWAPGPEQPSNPQQPYDPAQGGQPPQYGGQPPAYGAQQPYDPGQPQYGAQPPAYAGQPPAYTGQPQAPQYQSPGYPGQPYAQDPGKTMGIVGFVLAFLPCLSIAGLVVSIIARNKSKKAGFSNGLALAGIIISAVVIVISVIWAVVFGLALANAAEVCNDYGPGTHVVDGITYTCS